MKVAIDCDGVLANFTEAFIRVANRVFPGRFPMDFVPRSWGFDEEYLSKEEAERVWTLIKETPNFWTTLRPYNDSIHALAQFLMEADNVDVYIVTSRASNVGRTIAYQTQFWLQLVGIRGGNNYLGVLAAPHAYNKKTLYKAFDFDYSIDDKDTTVEECDTVPNHQAFLLDRPWNQDANVKRRVSTLGEFFTHVLAGIAATKGTENG